MARGIRILTDEEELQLLAQADLRARLSDKALARQWGLSTRQVRDILHRARRKRLGRSSNSRIDK